MQNTLGSVLLREGARRHTPLIPPAADDNLSLKSVLFLGKLVVRFGNGYQEGCKVGRRKQGECRVKFHRWHERNYRK